VRAISGAAHGVKKLHLRFLDGTQVPTRLLR
jgi:hypothetical protein